MENQNIEKPKNKIGISLLTGCGASVAAFVFPVLFCYALLMLLLPTESGYFIQMVLGPGCGIILALVMAIAGGVAVYRGSQPRPLAFGLLTGAMISLLSSLIIYGLGALLENYIPTLTATTTDSANAFAILMAVEVIAILVANVLAIVAGWVVYRSQRSKLDKAEPVG